MMIHVVLFRFTLGSIYSTSGVTIIISNDQMRNNVCAPIMILSILCVTLHLNACSQDGMPCNNISQLTLITKQMSPVGAFMPRRVKLSLSLATFQHNGCSHFT